MTFFQCAGGVLRFDVGRDDFDAGLIGGVHRGGGEIVGVAVEDETERFFLVDRAEVEFDVVELGESGEGEFVELRDVFAIVFGEERQNVAAFVVPCAERGVARVGAYGDDLEFGEWWIAGEALVGEDVVICGMIDREQANLIEVDGFFHRFHEAEAEEAVFRPALGCALRLSDIRRDRGRRAHWARPSGRRRRGRSCRR